jgi:hypothetical protein
MEETSDKRVGSFARLLMIRGGVFSVPYFRGGVKEMDEEEDETRPPCWPQRQCCLGVRCRNFDFYEALLSFISQVSQAASICHVQHRSHHTASKQI